MDSCFILKVVKKNTVGDDKLNKPIMKPFLINKVEMTMQRKEHKLHREQSFDMDKLGRHNLTTGEETQCFPEMVKTEIIVK